MCPFDERPAVNLPEIISILGEYADSPSTDPNLRHALQEVIRRLNGRAPKNTLKPHRQSPKEMIWSSQVRARAGYKCEAPGCNRIDVEAAHIFRRRHGATKFEPDCGIALCGFGGHHYWFDEEASPEEAEAFARSIVGDETYDRLQELSRQTLKRVPRPI